MSEQIRSADQLVKLAVANPTTLDALRANPAETLKELAKEATNDLPRVLAPSRITNNVIWLLIVGTFVLVALWSAYILGVNVKTPMTDGVNYMTKSETIIMLFTTAVAFLAGLLSPSPLNK